MFDSTHYVPVIRWKRGEKWALKNLRPDVRCHLTPLIELIPKNFEPKKIAKCKSLAGRMNEIVTEIRDSWGRSPCFIDINHAEGVVSGPSQEHPLNLFGNAMKCFTLKGIPVTGIERSTDQQNAAGNVAEVLGNGIGIRVSVHDILRESSSHAISALIAKLGRTRQETHLVVDLQALDPSAPTPATIVASIPHIGDWSTLTFLAGDAYIQIMSRQKSGVGSQSTIT